MDLSDTIFPQLSRSVASEEIKEPTSAPSEAVLNQPATLSAVGEVEGPLGSEASQGHVMDPEVVGAGVVHMGGGAPSLDHQVGDRLIDLLVRIGLVMSRLCYRKEVLHLAYESSYGGHLGFRIGISKQFYWPSLRKDLKRFSRSCHVCQVV